MPYSTENRMIWASWGLIGAIGLGAVSIADRDERPTANTLAAAAVAATAVAPVHVAQTIDPVIPAAAPAVAGTASTINETRLAAEIARLKARDSEQLVSVIRTAFDEQQPAIPLTFLLSIAYNETHGKVLAVSPAGAVGLAQATPSAYLMEEDFKGKLYVTNDYLVGQRNYIMKKPLGDAMNIANSLIRKNDAAQRTRAKNLLASAVELQREGMNELHVLEPIAPALFAQRVRQADEYNTAALAELGRLIDRGAPKTEMTRYRDRIQKQYRSMMQTQTRSWTAYKKDLENERDRLLRARYGMSPAQVITTRAYEAGEYLGQELDARFSPKEMARFLAAHLTTKQQEAQALGVEEDQLERWTAALYNGGAVNIKRMRAGLMNSLTETQRYMQKIPAMRESLDRVAS